MTEHAWPLQPRDLPRLAASSPDLGQGRVQRPANERSLELAVAYRRAAEVYASLALSRLVGRPCPMEMAAAAVEDFLRGILLQGGLAGGEGDGASLRLRVRAALEDFLRLQAPCQHRWAGKVSSARAEAAHGPAATHLVEARERLAFDRVWAHIVLERARQRSRALHPEQVLIAEDLLRTAGVGSPGMAVRLKVRPPVYAALRRKVRRTLRDLFCEELAATVDDAQQLARECRSLRGHLPRKGRG